MSDINGGIYTSDQKFGESKDGYVGLWFSFLSQIMQTLRNPDLALSSINVYLMGNQAIAILPNKDKRKELRKNLKVRIEEMKKEKAPNGEKISDSIIQQINILAVSEICGDIMDEIDNYLGIAKQNRISFDKDCHLCKFKMAYIEINPEGDKK